MQALSLGHALDVHSANAGAVHSVFAHAVNVEIRGDLWTLVSADRADLPFGIRVASRDFDLLGLRGGDRVNVRSGFVGIESSRARVIVDCRAAPRWIPTLQNEPAPGLAQRLAVVAAAANQRAWPGSARMASAMMAALHDPAALRSVLPDVVGCGPGSTPAGDDVLVGILAVLTSPHSGATGAAAASSLRRSLSPLLPMTTDISGHLLRQAVDGLFGRAVHELVCALIGDPAPRQLNETVQRVVETGATSGADMCAGLLAAAPSFPLCHERAAA
jgi:hypothetical protein